MMIRFNNIRENILCILFFFPQINYYLSSLLSSYNIQTITPLIYACLMLCGFLVIMWSFKRKKTLILLFFLLISLLLSVIINPETIRFMFNEQILSSPVIMLVLIYYPIFLLFFTKLDLNILLKKVNKYSVFIILIALVSFVNYVFVLGDNLPDYMTFSYMIISPIIFCTIASIHNKKMIFFSILGFVLIFIGGCRGALLTIAVFYILTILKYLSNGNRKRDVLLKVLILLFLISIIFFWEVIMKNAFSILESFGYHSRVFSTILGSSYGGEELSFFNSSTRLEIWENAIRSIRLIGYGLFGDRTVIVNEYNDPSYVHNWILEILLSFGLVLGMIVVALIFYFIIRAFIFSKKSLDMRKIMLSYALFSVLMIKHSISASFITSIDFWFYLGMGYYLQNNIALMKGGGVIDSKSIKIESFK